jgi:cation:H+ antiporter
MLLPTLQILAGLVLLTAGAELLVRAAVSLARRVGLSPLIIGLTVVSIGTSLPELVVSLDAVWKGSDAIGVGNVVGSNISNIALILGLSALVQPMRVEAQVIRLDGPILVGVSALLVVLVQDAGLGRLDGALLFAGAAGYLVYNAWGARRSPEGVQHEFAEGLPALHSLGRDMLYLTLGLGGLVLGADLLVEGALYVARVMDVPEMVIGLTVVAVGTSLPELATSMLAAYRGEGDIAIGNALGSSILNILGILGVTAALRPISTAGLTIVELATMVGVAVLVLPLLRTDFSLSRREGSLLVVVYVVYVAGLFLWG